MLEDVVALIAPPGCALCGGACELRRTVCDGCELALQRMRPVCSAVPGLDEVWSAAAYEGIARRLIGALKFGSRVALAEEAASLVAARAPRELLDAAIVPVPAAPMRRRRRGFDSAEAIAATLARRMAVPLVPCLARTHGRRQVGRRRRERLASPPRVQPIAPAPERALLVDDVTTTGATLAACADALRSAGTSWVGAVTLAASRRSMPLA
jgi:ComF family protein